jgi:leucyl aminopeptidase
MAGEVLRLAEKRGLDCEILGPTELREKGMGGILAVGGGSSHEPRLVRLEWGEGEEVTALVGKGVTFDTGGISIKPSAAMEEMKYDKCGACAVIGAAQTLAELRLPGRFRAYLPLAENMPGGRSYRPSDIVRCYNGKTVEILNTDAEGRMILADALAWAAEEKPDILIELSTLTGASVVALGSAAAALYTPDQELATELVEAGESSGERLWRMPLWAEFAEQMKGAHADLKNLGSRWGGANNAAAFLGAFVGRTRRWAHLDIAGTAYLGTDKGAATGATGFGVALIADWLLRRTGRF